MIDFICEVIEFKFVIIEILFYLLFLSFSFIIVVYILI